MKCPTCKDGSVKCPQCNGTGQKSSLGGFGGVWQCSNCKGSGVVTFGNCKGTGQVSK